jgi:hypothetical protein
LPALSGGGAAGGSGSLWKDDEPQRIPARNDEGRPGVYRYLFETPRWVLTFLVLVLLGIAIIGRPIGWAARALRG